MSEDTEKAVAIETSVSTPAAPKASELANAMLEDYGVKLSPMAEMYATLHEAYTALVEQHLKIVDGAIELVEQIERALDTDDANAALGHIEGALATFEALLS